MQDVVGGVDRNDAEDRVATADDEAPDGDNDVHGAQTEGVGPGGIAHGKQPECAGCQVDDVVPAVDREDAEHLDARVIAEHVVARTEMGVVEEPDNARDYEHSADDYRVQPRWTRVLHLRA